MKAPYDWEDDPGCSWLRHPAGRTLVDVSTPLMGAWWWVALGAALGATLMAVFFFSGN